MSRLLRTHTFMILSGWTLLLMSFTILTTLVDCLIHNLTSLQYSHYPSAPKQGGGEVFSHFWGTQNKFPNKSVYEAHLHLWRRTGTTWKHQLYVKLLIYSHLFIYTSLTLYNNIQYVFIRCICSFHEYKTGKELIWFSWIFFSIAAHQLNSSSDGFNQPHSGHSVYHLTCLHQSGSVLCCRFLCANVWQWLWFILICRKNQMTLGWFWFWFPRALRSWCVHQRTGSCR